ncbi:MAG: hypothetical protein L0Z07_06640 [Planctomycetes bacterium]|nr:hypothetical protein [Planctomycetota bacterium]
MLLDFEVQRSTRRCAATDRPLGPGEVCFSVLEVHGAEVVRQDFSREAWHGPSVSAFAWWMSRIPEPTAKTIKLAPNEVLLELFDQLARQPQQQDMWYVLTLLLVRRRVLRLDVPIDLSSGKAGQTRPASLADALVVYCPKRETTYEVPVVMPSETRIEVIQQQLSGLLTAGAD